MKELGVEGGGEFKYIENIFLHKNAAGGAF
jgi:hypothetical protein